MTKSMRFNLGWLFINEAHIFQVRRATLSDHTCGHVHYMCGQVNWLTINSTNMSRYNVSHVILPHLTDGSVGGVFIDRHEWRQGEYFYSNSGDKKMFRAEKE